MIAPTIRAKYAKLAVKLGIPEHYKALFCRDLEKVVDQDLDYDEFLVWVKAYAASWLEGQGLEKAVPFYVASDDIEALIDAIKLRYTQICKLDRLIKSKLYTDGVKDTIEALSRYLPIYCKSCNEKYNILKDECKKRCSEIHKGDYHDNRS